jgi:uncharacterized protein (DUF2237 family)
MALTGYTRTGYCVDKNDDQGSHHICIDLSSTNEINGNNFCQVTGQDDWCSTAMPCHDYDKDGGNDGYCMVQNWCVCQWAFASYVENAGGCDNIQTIICAAVNLEALLAYQQQSTTEKYQNALECIVNRCGLDMNALPTRSQNSVYNNNASKTRNSSIGTFVMVLLGCGILVGTIFVGYQKWLSPKLLRVHDSQLLPAESNFNNNNNNKE